jgi:hypothetical protein
MIKTRIILIILLFIYDMGWTQPRKLFLINDIDSSNWVITKIDNKSDFYKWHYNKENGFKPATLSIEELNKTLTFFFGTCESNWAGEKIVLKTHKDFLETKLHKSTNDLTKYIDIGDYYIQFESYLDKQNHAARKNLPIFEECARPNDCSVGRGVRQFGKH